MQAEVQTHFDAITNLLKPEDAQIALRDAVNKTEVTYVARSSRAIAENLNENVSTIKDQYDVKRATTKNPETTITTTRKPVPVIEFMTNAQISASERRPPGGARVRVRRGQAIERHVHSFVATMKSGHVGLFHRVGERDPTTHKQKIEQEYGPTVVGVLANAPDNQGGTGTIFEASADDAGETLIKNMDSQLDRFLTKYEQEK